MSSRALEAARAALVVRTSPPRIDALLLLAILPAVLVVILLVTIGFVSVRDTQAVSGVELTVQHYATLYTDRFAYESFFNTAGFALISLSVALLIGVPAAWLVERTDLPGKGLVFAAMMIGVLIPGFFTAMGWLFLLHPRIGLVNRFAMGAFGLDGPPLSIVNIPGMGWVQGLGLASLTFIMVAASLRAVDPSLEESAQMSGARFRATLWRITLPLVFPSVLAAGLYVLTVGISAFDIPLVIGLSNRIFLFSTYLYIQTHPAEGLPQYGPAAAFSAFMIALALLLSWWYGRVLAQARKYEVITGKNYRPKLIPLGRWALVAWLFLGGYVVLSKILPLLMVIWVAALPFLQLPSPEALQLVSLKNFTGLPWPFVLRGLSNTIVLVLAAPTLALLFSVVLSWVILRSRYRFRFLFDYAAFLPHAIPHIIFGVGALLLALYVLRPPFDLYGTVALLVITYALVQISFGTRLTNGALIQIHAELEEAAYTSGASRWDVLRRVIVPLLRPALLYGWLWLALISFRELTLATMLASPDNTTLPVVVWSMWVQGQLGNAAAVSLIMMALLLPLILVYWRVGSHFQEHLR